MALGNAYVAGETNSTQITFPVTHGPDLIYNGGVDAFVAKSVLTAPPSTLPAISAAPR